MNNQHSTLTNNKIFVADKRPARSICWVASILALALVPFLPPAAHADTLKAGVQQTDIKKTEQQGLGRGDITRGTDPFANPSKKEDDAGILEAPPGAFDANPFGNAKPLHASAQDEGGGNFNGQNMSPLMENSAPPPTQMEGNQGAPMQGNAVTPVNNDPDKSQAMMLLWDAWHKRVAETIYTRFNSSAQMFFKHSPPLACQVSYMVARDGRIGNVRVLQPSNNPIYNTMLLTVIKSMAGNPVLEYPPNSKRQFVEKSGTFTWNYSGNQGFKYFTGDKEQIQPGRGR
ncbi:MAG: TonB C-terminal domain-containing protein [Cyanobacteria bacterium REEB67]|nr:TonB C-terminal domain-containing protein [Cyanobacteria bacterium REEB67]